MIAPHIRLACLRKLRTKSIRRHRILLRIIHIRITLCFLSNGCATLPFSYVVESGLLWSIVLGGVVTTVLMLCIPDFEEDFLRSHLVVVFSRVVEILVALLIEFEWAEATDLGHLVALRNCTVLTSTNGCPVVKCTWCCILKRAKHCTLCNATIC